MCIVRSRVLKADMCIVRSRVHKTFFQSLKPPPPHVSNDLTKMYENGSKWNINYIKTWKASLLNIFII